MAGRLVFALVVALVLLAVDAAVWAGLRRVVPERWRRAAQFGHWLASGAVALAVAAGLALPPAGPAPSASWVLGLLALAGLPKLVFLAAWALEALLRLPLLGAALAGRDRTAARARRERLRRARPLSLAGAAAALVLLVLLGHAWALGRSALAIERVTVAVPDLPACLDGVRVVQISDLHLDSLGAAGVELVVKAVAATRPDLVVSTGDVGTLDECRRGPELLGRLSAPLGKLAVLGNHDLGRAERAADAFPDAAAKAAYLERLRAFYAERGFRLLVNECAVVERGGRVAVAGAGVFDPHHGWDDADLDAALAACPAAPALLLVHNPQLWESEVAGRRAVPLTLAGHTHAGQLALRLGALQASVAEGMFERWAGRHEAGASTLYVSRGVGYVGLPFRLGAAPEITIVELRRP